MKTKQNNHAFIWDLGGVILRAGDPTPNQPLAIRLSADPRIDETRDVANNQPKLCVEGALVDFIRVLRNSYPTALLVHNWKDLQLAFASLWQFEDAFDEIFVTTTPDLWEPGPPDFSGAIRELGVPAEHATLIDDDPRNVRAAQAAGLGAIQYHDPAQIGSALFEMLVEQTG